MALKKYYISLICLLIIAVVVGYKFKHRNGPIQWYQMERRWDVWITTQPHCYEEYFTRSGIKKTRVRIDYPECSFKYYWKEVS